MNSTLGLGSVARWLDGALGSDSGALGPVLDTLVILLIFFVLRRLLRKALLRKVDEPSRRYMIGKFVSYGLGTVAVMLVFPLWVGDQVDVGTWLGITSAGLAIALKDPVVNLAGWLYIVLRQPLRIGDRVQIGDKAGDVVDIGLFTFSLLEIGNWVHDDQSTGRLLHIPNGLVFREPVASYNQGFEYIWNELGVTVTFESDWQRARDVLTEIVWRHSENSKARVQEQLKRTAPKYMVHYKHLTPIVWVTVVDIGVRLDVRYLCEARLRRSSASALWADILAAFGGEQHVDYAYPTQRFYDAAREAKMPMRAPPTVRPGAETPVSRAPAPPLA